MNFLELEVIIIRKAKVKVIRESETGLNERVSIDDIEYTNNQAYKKAERGEVPGYHGVERSDGTKYIRSNPNGNDKDNLG